MARWADCRRCIWFDSVSEMDDEERKRAYRVLERIRPGSRLLGWCRFYKRPVSYYVGFCRGFKPRPSNVRSLSEFF